MVATNGINVKAEWYQRNYSERSHYLIFCTFSLEIKESSLSDTRGLILDVVAPQCGYKKMTRRCTRSSLTNLLCHDVISLECWEDTPM
jgi:hypothetical protein